MEAVSQSHSQYPAHEIPNEQRKQLALKIIKNEKPVSQLADEQKVSRNRRVAQGNFPPRLSQNRT